MIIRVPILFFVFVMLLQRISFSQEASFLLKSDAAAVAITAGEYCQFLNAVAATDPEPFYDEKMGDSNLILRRGEVGNYHYQIVAGNEEAPIAFMSKFSATYYLNWLQDASVVLVSTISAMTCDEELQLISSPFYLVKDFSLTSMQQSSEQEERSFLENVVIRAAGIGMLLVAGREMIIRGIPTERVDPLSAYFPERLQESSSARLEEDQPIMNIARSGSSPSLGVPEGTLNHSSTEATPAGSLQGTKVTSVPSEGKPAASLDWELLKKFPQSIFREAVFFSPAMPGGQYKHEYEQALATLRSTNPSLAEQVDFWKRAYDQWCSVQGEQKLAAYEKLQQIENNFSPHSSNFFAEAHAVTAFYRAGKVMEQFHSLQEKYFHALTAEKKGPVPYLLSEASKINDILAQSTSNIEALIDIVQTCQQAIQESNKVSYVQKSKNKEGFFAPLIAEKYKKVIDMVRQSLDEYASLIRRIETKDVPAIQSFLQKQAQRQAMILAKPALCASLHQRIKDWCDAGKNDNQIEEDLKTIDPYFNKALEATSCHAQIPFEKAGDYHLQELKERATYGDTPKARKLQSAALTAMEAGVAFERAGNAATYREQTYIQAGKYYLQSAEEIEASIGTPKVRSLWDAASAFIGAAAALERAGDAQHSKEK